MNPTQLAEHLIDQARTALRARFGSQVETVIWYGAVDVDPDYLTVWVLLTGPADTLPEWHFLGRQPRPAGVDDVTLARLYEMRAVIVECLRGKWPDAAAARIRFDSAERVRDHGGFDYFRG